MSVFPEKKRKRAPAGDGGGGVGLQVCALRVEATICKSPEQHLSARQ